MQNKTASRGLLLAAFLFAFSLAQAQTSVIPQVVDGGPWLTAIAITNLSANQEIASLSFFQETGGGNTSSWPLNFVEMTSAQAQDLILPAGTTLFLHTPGSAPATTIGWGKLSEVDGAGAVVAYAIFTQRVPGRSDQDGTAPAAAAISRILVPFNNTNGAVTSMAIANTTSSSETINVGIRTSSATTQPTAITLPAQGHASFSFPTQFAATAGQSGLAEFYAPTGSFSILALIFNSGAFTTAPVYEVTGPPIIASSSSGGSGTAGNITSAGFSISKETSTVLGMTTMSDAAGGQVSSYTPAAWQIPFAAQQFGPCSVLQATYPAGGSPPYAASAYLDAGTINLSGPNLPAGTTLVENQLPGLGPYYFYSPPAGVSFQPGGTYSISTHGGSQVGEFNISATLPTSFAVTGWDSLNSISRANGLTLSWTGSGFNTVVISITSGLLTASTTQEVTVACTVPASPATFSIPQGALALLQPVQAATEGEVGQLTLAATPATSGQATAVSSTSTTLTPPLVGGGQVNYGFFTPSLSLIRAVSIQ
jgi:hypothetical protein